MKPYLTLSLVALVLPLLCTVGHADPIEVKPFGTSPEGDAVSQIILTNNKGSSARLINYGAIVTNLFVPDKDGKLGDVVLGFDSVKEYAESGPYMGCIAGRFANRIARGLFTIDGTEYAVTVNAGTNCLHGGFKGYAKRMWTFDTGMTPDGPTVRFHLLDEDGTEGFPGNVKVTVLYTMTHSNALKIQYYATSDQATPINLTHHSYFNLRDGGKTEVMDYVARISADRYLPVDSTLIPTGEIAPVAGTPFDFTKAKLIGRDLVPSTSDSPGMKGYDHAMVLKPKTGDLSEAAEIYDPVSGRLLECWTTEPAVHFYTGNGVGALVGKNGLIYGPYRSFCLETEAYPDAPNHPNFPDCILRPGKVYRQVTEFRFSVPSTPLTPEQ